jgi:hypothetical protein
VSQKHAINQPMCRGLSVTHSPVTPQYLGRTGKCKVDETEKGWFITLIRVSEGTEGVSERVCVKPCAACCVLRCVLILCVLHHRRTPTRC